MLPLAFALLCLTGCLGLNYEKYEEVVKDMNGDTEFTDAFKTQVLTAGNGINEFGYRSFRCPKLVSATEPTSVHKLMPGDISVVGALGDSLTAANGALAKTPLGLLIQYRGVAAVGGGQKDLADVTTLANILKQYNPNVHGFSLGSGRTGSHNAQMNMAKPGAKSIDLVGQANNLVAALKSDSKVDYKKHWKVITVFIGGNDLCGYCSDKANLNPRKFISNVRDALDILHTNLPRTFVNLVTPVNVTFMAELTSGVVCGILNFYECKCASYPESAEAMAELNQVVRDYTSETLKLAKSGRYDTREDFTVVAQPFMQHTVPPRIMKNGKSVPDMTYFAPDCFHFSGKANAAAALALWNNMVEKDGQKRTAWSIGEPIECPTLRNPFFYTYKNSY